MIVSKDVQNRFFISFGFGSVFLKIFLKKKLIRFGMSLVWFGSENAFLSDIIVIYYSCNSRYYSDTG